MIFKYFAWAKELSSLWSIVQGEKYAIHRKTKPGTVTTRPAQIIYFKNPTIQYFTVIQLATAVFTQT